METTNTQQPTDQQWQKVVRKYNQPDLHKSIWQLVNTLLPYLALWYFMILSLEYSYLITFILSVIASGLLIRLFIIFHDCGHGSFFKSRRANTVVGMSCGMLSFTPYYQWHKQHQGHHQTTVNLDQRGTGDVWTMTVDEYPNSSKWRRFVYRAFRNPFILFGIGPLFMIFVQNRFSRKTMTRREKWNIYFTNAVMAAIAVVLSLLIGLKAYLLIQLPVLFISHSVGIWLFYIQHQFEDVSWNRNNQWDYKTAAIEGSSFLKLPAVLQWFTGNIGFHHLHHLSPRIPNYKLEKCQTENEMFQQVKPLRLISSFQALRLNLWDETNHQLIRFRKISVLRQV